jgi:hypothetical protein
MDNFKFDFYLPPDSKYGKLLAAIPSKLLTEKLKKAEACGYVFAAKRIALEMIRRDSEKSCSRGEIFNGHLSSDNDRFFVSEYYVGVGRQYASRVIYNGMHGYFEAITHHGHNLVEFLENRGLITSGDIIDRTCFGKKTGYSYLSKPAIVKIAEAYKISQAEVEWIAFRLMFSLCSVWYKREAGKVFDGEINRSAGLEDKTIKVLAEFLPEDMLKLLCERFTALPKRLGLVTEDKEGDLF